MKRILWGVGLLMLFAALSANETPPVAQEPGEENISSGQAPAPENQEKQKEESAEPKNKKDEKHKKKEKLPERAIPRPNAIAINPLNSVMGLVFGIYSGDLEYQRAITPVVGLTITGSFSYLEKGDLVGYGGQIEVGPRFSLYRSGLFGQYILPYLLYSYLLVENDWDGETYEGHIFGGGVLYGFNWIFHGFLIGIAAGPEAFGIVGGDLDDVVKFFPLRARVVLNIGYAF